MKDNVTKWLAVSAIILSIGLAANSVIRDKAAADSAAATDKLTKTLDSVISNRSEVVNQLQLQNKNLLTAQTQIFCVAKIQAQWSKIIGDTLILILSTPRNTDEYPNLVNDQIQKLIDIGNQIDKINKTCVETIPK